MPFGYTDDEWCVSSNKPAEDCGACSGEVCHKCGAGLINDTPYCTHDVIDRHEGIVPELDPVPPYDLGVCDIGGKPAWNHAVDIQTYMSNGCKHKIPAIGPPLKRGCFEHPAISEEIELHETCNLQLSSSVSQEGVIPNDEDLDWMESHLQRHARGFDAWWEQFSNEQSGRDIICVIITIWEAGRGAKKPNANN